MARANPIAASPNRAVRSSRSYEGGVECEGWHIQATPKGYFTFRVSEFGFHSYLKDRTGSTRAALMAGIEAPTTAENTATPQITPTSVQSTRCGITSKK